MKWENDVASGEGVRAPWRQSLIFLRYPFPLVLPHLFPIPVLYPTWLTRRWLLAQPGTWRVLANERIMKREVVAV